MARKKESTPTAEIVVAEPLQAALPASAVAEDTKLVDKAAKHIRDILGRTVTRGLEDVGLYLLDTFYDGNIELYRSTRPSKHASLRLLEQRCETLDLPVSRTFLANAIGVAVMTRQLPKNASFLRLPPGHRLELLPMREPEKVEEIASKAVDGKLTVANLRDLVRKERSKGKTAATGRKPTPKLLSVLSSCARLLRNQKTGRLVFRKADVTELTPEQVEEVKEMRETIVKRMEEVEKLLGG